ncbi:hypothetical protein [Tautonia marina]|uniref:hypothetical protein n=1 Tax=Tautonia marina TaxID=2653855 RepID=UPI001375B298|nr:hypothetical protein [Tautonia marina]
MRIPHPRFTVLGMMLAIALIALDLAAASATHKAFPRRSSLPVSIGNGRGMHAVNPDGSWFYARGNAERGYRDPRMIRPPMPTLARRLSPTVAGLSVSVIVLGLAAGRPRSRYVRIAALVVLVPLAAVSLQTWWVLYGGGVPVQRLSLDLPEDEVRRVLSTPLIEGTTLATLWKASSSTWIAAPTGSLRYLVLDFDDHGRLRSFTPASHERGGHPAWRAWHHDQSVWSFWRNANP